MPPLGPNESYPPLVRSIASALSASSTPPPALPPRAPRQAAQSQSPSSTAPPAPVPAYSHPKTPTVNRLPRRGSAHSHTQSHSHSQPQLQTVAMPIGPEVPGPERVPVQFAAPNAPQRQHQQQHQQQQQTTTATQNAMDSPRSATTSSSDSPRGGGAGIQSLPQYQPSQVPLPPAQTQQQNQLMQDAYHRLQATARVSPVAQVTHSSSVGSSTAAGGSGAQATAPSKYVIRPPPAPAPASFSPSDAIRPPTMTPVPAALGSLSLSARENSAPIAVPETSSPRSSTSTAHPSPRLPQAPGSGSRSSFGSQVDPSAELGSNSNTYPSQQQQQQPQLQPQQQQPHQAPEPLLMRHQFVSNKALIGWYMELRRQTMRTSDKREEPQQMRGSGGSTGSLSSSTAAQDADLLNPFSPFADLSFLNGATQQVDEEEDEEDDVDAVADDRDRNSAHSLETQNSTYSAPEMASNMNSALQFRVPTREDYAYAPSSASGTTAGALRLQEQQRYASTGALPRALRQDVPLAVSPSSGSATLASTSTSSQSQSQSHVPATRRITAPRVLPPGASARLEESSASVRSSQEEPDVPLGSNAPASLLPRQPGSQPQLSTVFSADATQRARALGYLPDAQSQHWYQTRELNESSSSSYKYLPSNSGPGLGPGPGSGTTGLQQSGYGQSAHNLPSHNYPPLSAAAGMGGSEDASQAQIQQPYARQQAYNLEAYLAGLSLGSQGQQQQPQPSSHAYAPGGQSNTMGMQYDRSASANNNFLAQRANRD